MVGSSGQNVRLMLLGTTTLFTKIDNSLARDQRNFALYQSDKQSGDGDFSTCRKMRRLDSKMEELTRQRPLGHKRPERKWHEQESVTRLGLEPRMTEPKSVVLPITPPGKEANFLLFFRFAHNGKCQLLEFHC